MKHAISSVDYLLRMKGFRHGAGGFPMQQEHTDSSEYNHGYRDGQASRWDYSKSVCKAMGLINTEIGSQTNHR